MLKVFNDEIIEAFSKSNNFKIFQYSRKLNKVLAKYFFPENISHFNFKERTFKGNFELF